MRAWIPVLAVVIAGCAQGPPPDFKWREVEIDRIEIGYGIQLTDLDGDGRPDIVAAARQTKNLKIFFSKP